MAQLVVIVVVEAFDDGGFLQPVRLSLVQGRLILVRASGKAESNCQVLHVASSTTCFKTVRFGNVLGFNGSVAAGRSQQPSSVHTL